MWGCILGCTPPSHEHRVGLCTHYFFLLSTRRAVQSFMAPLRSKTAGPVLFSSSSGPESVLKLLPGDQGIASRGLFGGVTPSQINALITWHLGSGPCVGSAIYVFFWFWTENKRQKINLLCELAPEICNWRLNFKMWNQINLNQYLLPCFFKLCDPKQIFYFGAIFFLYYPT